eukprot:scaffold4532_cov117-Skeletonema_dohrnii-CCMP3373.AAC.4
MGQDLSRRTTLLMSKVELQLPHHHVILSSITSHKRKSCANIAFFCLETLCCYEETYANKTAINYTSCICMMATPNAIQLYRRCIRSIKLIRDHSQRATFFEYTRDGFRRHRHLHPDSREAYVACNDALEQVKSMEYYQQMQATKLKENKNKHPPNYYSRDISATSESRSIQATPVSEKTQVVAQWLLSQLPHMHKDDASEYSTQLYDLGFDSIAFIEEELIEEDLSFMKSAHRRVMMRQLSKIRAEKELE